MIDREVWEGLLALWLAGQIPLGLLIGRALAGRGPSAVALPDPVAAPTLVEVPRPL